MINEGNWKEIIINRTYFDFELDPCDDTTLYLKDSKGKNIAIFSYRRSLEYTGYIQGFPTIRVRDIHHLESIIKLIITNEEIKRVSHKAYSYNLNTKRDLAITNILENV